MKDLLVWVYAVNAVILIIHEIDSAYWHEWELFKLKGGIAGFLIMHVPMLAVIFWGFLEAYKQSFLGVILSIVIAVIGIGAFIIHGYFIRKGNKEFTTTISQLVLRSALIVSIAQLALALYIIISNGGA